MRAIITVDVEASTYKGRPLPFDKMVFGDFDGKQFGVAAIMDICEAYNVKATFFVDVFEYQNVGESRLKDVCMLIKNRGHDVQLHTHPSRIWDRMCMKDYSLEDQIDIIKKGADLLFQWIGEHPIAHRAGSFGANEETLLALRENNIFLDSSLFASYPHCQLNSKSINQVFEYNGTIEVPPTLYIPLKLGKFVNYRNVDIDACTLSELKHVTKVCNEKGLSVMTVLLHSFSFIKRNPDSTIFSPDDVDMKRFDRFLSFCTKDLGTEFITMKELYEEYKHAPENFIGDDVVPTTGFFKTFIRACQRWRTSRKNQILILFVLLFFGIMFFLIYNIVAFLFQG